MKKRTISLILAVMLALLPVVAQAEGDQDERTVPLSARARPVVSPEAESLFIEAYGVFSPKTKFSSLDEFYQLYGEEVGDQCANSINYYYDTGKEWPLDTVRRLIKGMGSTAFYINEYTPGSASSKADVTEAPFPDVPVDAWYAEAVAAMKNSGIINGCDDGLFHPEREVKTGEFYAMLLRAGTRDGVDVTKAEGVDNDTHWAKGVMTNAYRSYLWSLTVSGYEDDIVLRGEAVCRVISLRRLVEKKNSSYKTAWEWTMARERTEGTMTFEDIPDHAIIEQYLKEGRAVNSAENFNIVYAYNHGIVKGVDIAGNFNPYGTLTRAEVAQMFYNALLTKRFGGLNLGGSAG